MLMQGLDGKAIMRSNTMNGSFLIDSPEKLEKRLMGWFPLAGRDVPCLPPLNVGKADLPSLISIKKWHSQKERPEESISLLTHATVEHLAGLENQCITWPDPIVAIVYLPMSVNSSGGNPSVPHLAETSFDDVLLGLDSFHYFMEATAACALHIELVGQFIPLPDFPGPYPTNALRNRAMLLSPTNLAILINSDFVVTPMLGIPGEGYRDKDTFYLLESILNGQKALVVPALTLQNRWQEINMARNIARGLVIAGKDLARDAMGAGSLKVYRPDIAPTAHTVINFDRWAASNDSKPLSIKYKRGMDTCTLVSLKTVQFFDERFVDQTGGAPWLAHLSAKNFTFAVISDGFAVNVPHPAPVFANKYVEAQENHRQLKMQSLQEKVLQEIEAANHIPILSECRTKYSRSSRWAAFFKSTLFGG